MEMKVKSNKSNILEVFLEVEFQQRAIRQGLESLILFDNVQCE